MQLATILHWNGRPLRKWDKPIRQRLLRTCNKIEAYSARRQAHLLVFQAPPQWLRPRLLKVQSPATLRHLQLDLTLEPEGAPCLPLVCQRVLAQASLTAMGHPGHYHRWLTLQVAGRPLTHEASVQEVVNLQPQAVVLQMCGSRSSAAAPLPGATILVLDDLSESAEVRLLPITASRPIIPQMASWVLPNDLGLLSEAEHLAIALQPAPRPLHHPLAHSGYRPAPITAALLPADPAVSSRGSPRREGPPRHC